METFCYWHSSKSMGSSSGCGDHSLNICLELLVHCKGVIQWFADEEMLYLSPCR